MKKKIFTLFAFLAMFMGANAANWVQVYSDDYSSRTAFPFYVMGYVPEWINGVMTDPGAMYGYKTDDEMADATYVEEVGTVATSGGTNYHKLLLAEPAWHQYFIADGIKTQLDGHYKVVATVKASEAVSVNVNMGWGWSDGQQASNSVSIGTDWAEVEWEYSGINGTSCNLVAQPGTSTATIEWKNLTVYEDQAEQRPVTWQEWLTNDGTSIIPGQTATGKYMGDAETPWADPSVKFNDQSQNFLICAWSKEKGHNMNENDGWDPFPANIEAEPGNPSNHVFVVHGQPATTEGDASAWDNQFWIQSPKAWPAGTQVKVHFRYKASQNVSSTDTQIHHQNPSDYLVWHAVGNIAFTTEWQEFDDVMTIADDMANGWSIAFNLNPVVKDAVDFYFDDLSWQTMVLDEGWFVASSNTTTGLAYDFDNAKEFTDNGDLTYTAVVGTLGDPNSWVNEVMISTIRGNTQAFRGATIKPSSSPKNDPDDWPDYTPASNYKIKLPAAGVWEITVDTDFKALNFIKLEGEADKTPITIVPNPTEVVINTIERDYTSGEQEGGTGQPWDNQFWILANRILDAGEETVIEFDYVADREAKTTTQTHAQPGEYRGGGCGDVNFTTEWLHFATDFTIPSTEKGDIQSMAFNLSEIKDACKYTIKNVVWRLKDSTESLIDQNGGKNFYVKLLGGTPEAVESGISSVVSDSKVSNATYNLAGQRVSNGYKGIVVKNGAKYIAK